METLDKAIETSVLEIPSGNIFDSHAIIKMLLQQHSDCYLREMPKKDSCTTKTYHSQIADKIDLLTEFLEPVGTSYSFNIHNKLSPCKCWKRK